jgi:hypothetical protein
LPPGVYAEENEMTETTETPGTGDAAPTDPSPATPVAPETIAAIKGAKTQRHKSLAEVLANQQIGSKKPATEDPTMPKQTKTTKAKSTKPARSPKIDLRTFAIRVTPQVQAAIHKAAKAAGLSGTEWATNALVKAAAK